MNKRDLIEDVCTRLTTTKSGAEEAVNAVLGAIQHGLGRDRQVALAGFGNFLLRRRSAHVGRNPRTGLPLQIPSRVSVLFHPAKSWRETLAELA